jgi:hypothetical protein
MPIDGGDLHEPGAEDGGAGTVTGRAIAAALAVLTGHVG